MVPVVGPDFDRVDDVTQRAKDSAAYPMFGEVDELTLDQVEPDDEVGV